MLITLLLLLSPDDTSLLTMLMELANSHLFSPVILLFGAANVVYSIQPENLAWLFSRKGRKKSLMALLTCFVFIIAIECRTPVCFKQEPCFAACVKSAQVRVKAASPNKPDLKSGDQRKFLSSFIYNKVFGTMSL